LADNYGNAMQQFAGYD